MKGALGLTVAAGLGIIGAFSNWFYLQRLASREEKLYFIAVKTGQTINTGDVIKLEQLEQVGIPRNRVDYLTAVAPQWSAVHAVRDRRANRTYHGGEIILKQDLAEPSLRSPADTLQPDEVIRWVPIDPGALVPDHINPGDLVSFDVARVGGSIPTPAGSSADSGPGRAFTPSEIIGPFRVASIGARREPEQVWDGKRRAGSSENKIEIIVKFRDGRLEPKAERLFEAIRLAGNQGVHVQLHSAKLDEK